MMQANLFIILRILLHILPLWPLLHGRIYFTLAALLFVALPYIKVMKLKARCLELKEKFPHSAELKRCVTTLGFWQKFTFLPSSPQV